MNLSVGGFVFSEGTNMTNVNITLKAQK